MASDLGGEALNESAVSLSTELERLTSRSFEGTARRRSGQMYRNRSRQRETWQGPQTFLANSPVPTNDSQWSQAQPMLDGQGASHNSRPISIPTVDLFSGCGGLSLGFEIFSGTLAFDVVMALDNDSSTVKCFNHNHQRSVGSVPIARLADLTWFAHPSEVLLYYLAHRALLDNREDLREALDSDPIRWTDFLTSLRATDRLFEGRLEELTATALYRSAISRVDKGVFSLAICKSFMARLGLGSLLRGRTTPELLPWFAEYSLVTEENSEGADIEFGDIAEVIRQDAERQWDAEIEKIYDAAVKRGHGQHQVVNSRLQTLVGFLESEPGRQLRIIWIEWRSRRDSIRANACMGGYPALRDLYRGDLRVKLMLGGPPCKGFSRIGRAVLESLRDQGASAWTSHEYGDERNALMHKYVLFLEAFKPDIFLFENVAHFASALRTPSGKLDASKALEEAIIELSGENVHYEVNSQIVRAREHAVPQDRERFIMVGFNVDTTPAIEAANAFFKLRNYCDDVPLQLALQGLSTPAIFTFGQSGPSTGHRVTAYTLVDMSMPPAHIRYINWIRQLDPLQGQPPRYVDAHIVRRGRADDVGLMRRLAPGQRWMDLKLRSSETVDRLRDVLEKFAMAIRENPDLELPTKAEIDELLSTVDDGLMLRLMLEDISSELPEGETHHLLAHQYLNKGTDAHGDWLERLYAHRPCKTIVAHIGKDTYGYIHPYENRAISMREAARVQSFPDWYSFATTGMVEGYAMIGNAVPPLLAHAFAERLAILHDSLGLFMSNEPRVEAPKLA